MELHSVSIPALNFIADVLAQGSNEIKAKTELINWIESSIELNTFGAKFYVYLVWILSFWL